MPRWIRWLASQWFTLGMALLLGLAWLRPEVGERLAAGGRTRDGAIVLIFFLSGAILPGDAVRRGLCRWSLHVFVQGFGFGLCPLIAWAAMAPWRSVLPEPLIVGFYGLAVLPTTITSCFVFTQLSGGNAAGALVNAVAGNLAGIVLSPALLGWLTGAGGVALELDYAAIVAQLAQIVLAPFAAGQICRAVWDGRLDRWRSGVSTVNSLCVLLIVYFAFCQTFAHPEAWQSVHGAVLPLVLLVPAHGALLALAALGARWCGLPPEDRIAAIFCAPQKTLSLGLPMIAACLASRPEWIGQASLPLIVYHPLQLFAAGLLKDRFASQRAPTSLSPAD